MRKKALWVIGAFVAVLLAFSAFSGTADAKAETRTIDHNKPLAVGEFMEPVEGYKFKTNEDVVTKEYDRFILYINPGVYVSEDFADTVNTLMDMIEKNTEARFFPKNSPLEYYEFYKGTSTKKVTIEILNSLSPNYKTTTTYYGSRDIRIGAEVAATGELTDKYGVLLEELLEVAMQRTYGVQGFITWQGYTWYNQIALAGKLQKKYGAQVRYDNAWNMMMNTVGTAIDPNSSKWENTEEYVDKMFFHKEDSSPVATSYWVIKYIVDNYGEAGLNKYMKAIAQESIAHSKTKYSTSNLTYEEEIKVLKATFSKNIVKEFMNWYVKQDIYNYDTHYDFRKVDYVALGFRNYLYYDDRPAFESLNDFSFCDSIEIDYTRALAFSQQMIGFPCKGISGCFSGYGKVDFYDQYGTVIYSFGSEYSHSTKSVCVPYATKFIITAPGEHEYCFSIDSSSSPIRDVAFNDVSCTQAKVITVEDATSKDKTLNRKVKNEKDFLKALDAGRTYSGKITVSADITVNSDIRIPEGVTVSVKKGKVLTLKDCCYVDGTLSLKENKSLVLKGGWLWLEEASTLKIGKVTISTKVIENAPHTGYGCGFRLDPYSKTNKFEVSYGSYNRLYVKAPKGTTLDQYVVLDELREGAEVYFNKKKVK